MKQVLVALIILVYLFIASSCAQNNIRSKPKSEQYIIDVVYVYDEALPTFNSATLLNLFRYHIPYLTKQTLGYDVLFNIKTGMTEKEFYNSTKRVLATNTTILKDSYVNIFDASQNEIETILSNSISKAHPFRLEYLFDTTNASSIVERYSKKNIKNILAIYNMKLSKRDRLFQNEYPFINRAFYWSMISSSYRSADMIIVNMPIVSLSPQMDIKSIADYGFVDRIVSRNEERSLGVNSIVTTYPLLSNDSLFNSIRENIDKNIEAEVFTYYIVQTIGMMLGGYDTLENELFSIMNEVVGFQYKTWYNHIKNADRLTPPYKLLKEYPYYHGN